MNKTSIWLLGGAMALCVALPGCSGEANGDGDDDAVDGVTVGDCADGSDELGCAGVTQDEIREEIPGPLVRSGGPSEVWAVTRQWSQVDNTAGIAWEANSGLTWEEKYHAWMQSLEKVPGVSTDTVRIVTPQGRVLDAPVLECADQLIFFRLAFAAWYNLPFYLSGWVNGAPAYFGHFGVVDKNGRGLSSFPSYRVRYQDHTSRWREGDPWPSDAALRTRNAGYADSHGGVLVDGEMMDATSRFGAYLDEFFLNKRAGHLAAVLVAYFGSVNLADGANTFQIKGNAVAAGDALLKRWQKRGIGHAMIVTRVNDNADGESKQAALAQGFMPARQAEWLSPQRAHSLFSDPQAGGEGQTYDSPPVPYVALGGGLRRWRTPEIKSGRWNLTVSRKNRANYIEDRDHAALLQRWREWPNLLRVGTPSDAYEIAAQNVIAARAKLHNRPASCSSRSQRESAWSQLVRAGQVLGKSEAEVFAEHGSLEDYVFAELIYNRSKTCCWLKPGREMFDIIMDYAHKEQREAAENGQCVQPTPFRAENGGYARWAAHAESIGRGNEWRAWTQDESPCPAANANTSDPLTHNGERAFCE